MKRAIHYLLIATAVYVVTFLTNIPDLDLWARLAVGSIFFQTGHVLRHDIFSYLPTKDLWIDHEWGSGVVLYGFAKYLGQYGIFILKALLIYSIFLTILKTINTREGKRSPSVLFYVFLGWALFPGIGSLLRSQMFTYLFFILWIYGLERVRKKERKIFWLFPCTMLFWVNLHGGFVAGIGLVFLYAAGDLLNRKSPLPYLLIGLSLLPVMLINPYGFALWRFVVESSLMARPFNAEWDPISLSGPKLAIGGLRVHSLSGYMLLVAMTLAAGCRSLLRREKVDWTRVIVLGMLFFLSIRLQRNAVFFVLAASSLLYHQFDALVDEFRKVLTKAFPRHSSKIQAVAHWGLGFVLPAIIFICIIPRLSHRTIVDFQRYPVGSIEFLRRSGLSGNLATAFDWGSYASWKLYPQCKVMIDGRYEEVFPKDVFDVAIRFSERQGNWWEALSRFHTDLVVLPKTSYTQADLSLFPGWKAVYQDFVSVVLLPTDIRSESIVRPNYKNPAYSTEDLAKPMAGIEGSSL